MTNARLSSCYLNFNQTTQIFVFNFSSPTSSIQSNWRVQKLAVPKVIFWQAPSFMSSHRHHSVAWKIFGVSPRRSMKFWAPSIHIFSTHKRCLMSTTHFRRYVGFVYNYYLLLFLIFLMF